MKEQNARKKMKGMRSIEHITNEKSSRPLYDILYQQRNQSDVNVVAVEFLEMNKLFFNIKSIFRNDGTF